MKILFAGVIYPGHVTTTALRLEVLRALGHDVRPLCLASRLRWGGRLGGAAFRRLLFGPPLALVNRALRRAADELGPDLLWVEKGIWITPRTLSRIRSRHAARLVHYTPDPAFTTHRSRHFFRSIPLYDLLITNKRYEIDLYRRYGARRLDFRYAAFDLDLHRPVELDAAERRLHERDVVFIGTYAAGRERYLRALCRAGVDLAIWGSYWERCPDAAVRARFQGSILTGEDYARGLSGARIGLGLLSPLHPDRSTTRSVEIPACGTLLLAERTGEHQELFAEGVEAEFFADEEELLAKVNHLLEHPAERQRIAAAGRRRCLESGYSYQHQLAALFEELEETIERRES